MHEKTKGIVLSQIKYTDSGIVVRLYTRNFGRQSFLLRGMRNKKKGKHNILFQPMFILELEMLYKASREMQTMKEFSVSFNPYNIYSDIRKSTVAIFLGEFLTSVLSCRRTGPHAGQNARFVGYLCVCRAIDARPVARHRGPVCGPLRSGA